MNWHRGDWMATYTGRKFWPNDPSAEDIDIVDIAHALSMTCRFGGHAKQFYSVAQHSVLMSEKATAPNAMRALMHDAPEAYIGDVVRPLKKHPSMKPFGEVERAVELAICAKFQLPFHIANAEVHELDNRILLDERDQVMTWTPFVDGWPNCEPLGVTIERWPPEIARVQFLNAFDEYQKWDGLLFREAAQ